MLAAVQKCVLGEPPVNGIKLEPRSTMLMLENALATEKLSPSRQWVPWLTINDEPVCKTDKDFAQMLKDGGQEIISRVLMDAEKYSCFRFFLNTWLVCLVLWRQ